MPSASFCTIAPRSLETYTLPYWRKNALMAVFRMIKGFSLFSYHKIYDVARRTWPDLMRDWMWSFACASRELHMGDWSS